MNNRVKNWIGVLCLLIASNVFAGSVEYSLDYDSDSPIKDLPLANAQLKIEIFEFDKPHGYEEVKTDEHASFTLDKAVDLEVVSIQGEEQYQARCSGSATIANPLIKIRCQTALQDNQP